MRLFVGFTTNECWISRAIRWFTKSPRSHAYLHFAADSIDIVFEAAWDGFRMAPLSDRGMCWTEIEVTKFVNVTKAFATCNGWWMTPYDYRGLFGEAWVMLGRWLGRTWRNPLASPHAMYCSEAALYVLQASWNPPLPPALATDPRSVDPGELLQLLDKVTR
jgi:hypothetical protein